MEVSLEEIKEWIKESGEFSNKEGRDYLVIDGEKYSVEVINMIKRNIQIEKRLRKLENIPDMELLGPKI